MANCPVLLICHGWSWRNRWNSKSATDDLHIVVICFFDMVILFMITNFNSYNTFFDFRYRIRNHYIQQV